MGDKKEQIQIAISTLKGTIGAIPVVGGLLNEYLFEVRGRLKQERINSFVESFAEYLSQFKEVQLGIDQIKKEEFGDFFEEVILKVSKTRSEEKREAFKKILSAQILRPKNYDYAEILLDTIDSLHEKQIPILKELHKISYTTLTDDKGELLKCRKELNELKYQRTSQFSKSLNSEYPNDDLIIQNLNSRISTLESQIQTLERRIKTSIEDGEIKERVVEEGSSFLIQDLCNKGLAIDTGMRYGLEPFRLIKISQLGIDLIRSLQY